MLIQPMTKSPGDLIEEFFVHIGMLVAEQVRKVSEALCYPLGQGMVISDHGICIYCRMSA